MGASRYGEILTSLDIGKYEIFGTSYIINTINRELKEDAYRNYISDALRMIAENTSKPYGGSYPKLSYREVITPVKEETPEKVDCNEVVSGIWNKLTRRDNNGT